MVSKTHAELEERLDKEAHYIIKEMLDAYQKVDRIQEMVEKKTNDERGKKEASQLAGFKDQVHDIIKNEIGGILEEVEADVEDESRNLQADIERIVPPLERSFHNLVGSIETSLGSVENPESVEGGALADGSIIGGFEEGFRERFIQDLIMIKKEWVDVLNKLDEEIKLLKQEG